VPLAQRLGIVLVDALTLVGSHAEGFGALALGLGGQVPPVQITVGHSVPPL
jgi:hypothetical protein